MKPTLTVYELDIYNIKLAIVTNATLEFLDSTFKDSSKPVFDDGGFEAVAFPTNFIHDNKKVVVIYTENDTLKVSTVVHESVHCADEIFNHIGAAHDFNNPETYAYLVGYITDLTLKALNYGK